jgi:hypothetical protein
VPGVVELGVPAVQAAAAAGTLGSPARLLALAFAADGIQRGVGAADEMEVITDDPRGGQHAPDRLAVVL